MKKKEEFDENNNLNGIKSLYGYSKITSEMLIEEYSYAFNLEYLIIRSGLITGPWQFGKVEQGLINPKYEEVIWDFGAVTGFCSNKSINTWETYSEYATTEVMNVRKTEDIYQIVSTLSLGLS